MQTLTLSGRLALATLPSKRATPTAETMSPLSPDVIARGRALAADSSYPPFDICEKIAAALIDHPVKGTQCDLLRKNSRAG